MAVFGDMGTAEADGTLDAGHDEELPSIKTVGVLMKHLRVGNGGVAGSPREAFAKAVEGKRVGDGLEPTLGLVLHIGDLSYARGYDTQWDEVRRCT